MMTAYILKLIVLVPLVAGLAFGALWLWRKAQGGMSFGQRERAHFPRQESGTFDIFG